MHAIGRSLRAPIMLFVWYLYIQNDHMRRADCVWPMRTASRPHEWLLFDAHLQKRDVREPLVCARWSMEYNVDLGLSKRSTRSCLEGSGETLLHCTQGVGHLVVVCSRGGDERAW